MAWDINEFTGTALGRVLTPFENNTDNLVKLIRAFSTAIRVYANHYRYGSKEPYINHALKVALILLEELRIYDVDIISIALLHEVIEKSDNKPFIVDHLCLNFGQNVCDTVQIMTEPNFSNGNRDELLSSYFQYFSKSSRISKVIKLADRLENIRFLKNIARKNTAFRYKEETQKYIMPLAERIDETLAFKLSIALYEIK